MSLHADILLIRGDVRATISAVLAGFGAGEVQPVARGSYSEVLASAGAGEQLFAVRWVDGWTLVVGGALTIYGRDGALEELATHLGCEVLVANAVGTSGAYGFSLFNPNPTRQFAITTTSSYWMRAQSSLRRARRARGHLANRISCWCWRSTRWIYERHGRCRIGKLGPTLT